MKPTVKKRGRASILTISCGMFGCIQEFRNAWELNEHITDHLKEIQLRADKVLQCKWDTCDFQTECLDELRRHIYYHGYHTSLLMQGKFECDENPNLPKCTQNCDNRNKIPELKFDFYCEWTDCQRTFCSIVEFQDHIVQHASFEYEIEKSPDDERPKIQCNWQFCKKELENKYRLIEHIRKHSNKKYVACWQCGELFRTKTTLFDHCKRQPMNNTHKYQCAQCFKFFGTEKLLRGHVQKHFNCYKCSMCDMTCTSSSALATHIRYRHLKDRPFKCSKCEHRCVRKSDLVKHMKHAHSQEVHHCDETGCNYTVRTYNLLRRHYLEVHGNSPYIYICHCCDKLFKSSKTLSSHLIKVHEIEHSSGHKRFTYRMDENGFYQLETMRIESLDVIKQILSPHPFDSSEMTQDSSCYEIVSKTNKVDERVLVSKDVADTVPVGEVVISIPSIEQNSHRGEFPKEKGSKW